MHKMFNFDDVTEEKTKPNNIIQIGPKLLIIPPD